MSSATPVKKLTNLFLLFFLTLSVPVFSQEDSSAYQKFFSRFIASYKATAVSSTGNYFEIIAQAARMHFTVYNDLFIPAANEVMTGKNSNEAAAVEALFWKTVTDLKPLLPPDSRLYNDNRGMLALYTTILCPCITSKVKETDQMEIMKKAMGDCINATIMKDTAYLGIARKVAAGKTTGELNTIQQYAFLYAYQNCPVINRHFSKVLLNEPVLSTYYMELEEMYRNNGIKVVELYKSKKLDSLITIFPLYKNFLPALEKAAGVLKTAGTKMRAGYYANNANNEISISFVREKNNKIQVVGRLVMKTTAATTTGKIKSAVFDIPKQDTLPDDEKIMEISDGK